MKHSQTDAFRAADVTSERSLLERLIAWHRFAESLEEQLIAAEARAKAAEADLRQIQLLRRERNFQ